MKKFTLSLFAALVAVASYAQKDFKRLEPKTLETRALQVQGIDRKANPVEANGVRKAPKADELVTLPDGVTPEQWYLKGTINIYSSSGWQSKAIEKQTNVAIVGNDVYVQGLAYYFSDAYIKGSIVGNTISFETGQFVGEDEYGPEYIIGSNDGGATLAGIIFTYDAAAKTIQSKSNYLVIESGSATELDPFAYWSSLKISADAPATPTTVVAPVYLLTEEYSIKARNYKDDADVFGSIHIGFDGNDVYFKGFSTRYFNAWVKGTLADNVITLPYGQLFGASGSTSLYLNTLVKQDVVFDYDATSGKLTARNEFFLVDNEALGYYDSYRNAVLTKIVEKAGTPANPQVIELVNTNYGYVVDFDIPTVDTEGNGLITSKLSYQLFVEENGQTSALVFTPQTHTKLTESLSVIPYNFSEQYDFYPTYIYLNELYSATWTKIGIKSIYTGGGETHETEIQWYEIGGNGSGSEQEETDEVVSLPEGVEPETYTLAIEQYDTDDLSREVDAYVAFDGTDVYVSGLAFWFEDVYVKGTLDTETNIVTFPSGQFVGEDSYGPEYIAAVALVDDGENIAPAPYFTFSYNPANKSLTLVGDYVIVEADEPEPADWGNIYTVATSATYTFGALEPLVAVEVPANLETSTYLFTAASAQEYGKDIVENYSSFIQVGFDGDDAYIGGLVVDDPDLFVKATKNTDGKYVVPANQYLGFIDFYGYFQFDYFFTAVDAETAALVDAVFDFDAATKTFTNADQILAVNGDRNKLDYYMLFSGATFSPFTEVEATPADPTIEKFSFYDTTILPELEPVQYPYISFYIPNVGTDGNYLNTDKLTYTLYIVDAQGAEKALTFTPELYTKLEKEIVEIPYTFDDDWDIYEKGERVYLNWSYDEIASWKKIGVQSIYRGLDIEHRSAIVWFDIESYTNALGIESIVANDNAVRYFDLQGRLSDGKANGLYIKQVGTKTSKVLNK